MSWYKVRLELARTPQYPQGSSSHGYELIVPLDADGHLDEHIWRSDKKQAVVRRFWPDQEGQQGNLIHTRHRTWAFSYEPGEDDDTPIFHLENHLFRHGEYISVKEQDGETMPYRVISVTESP